MSQPTPTIDRHTVHALQTLQRTPGTSMAERWQQTAQTAPEPATQPGEIGN